MKKYFTVGEVAKSTGFSRATILRLEEKGLLKPAKVDTASGYRYYDNHNITLILQIKNFLSLGMTYDEIGRYFASAGESEEVLSMIEERMFMLKRLHEEISLRFSSGERISFERLRLPSYVCYAREFEAGDLNAKYDAMYNLYTEVISKGLKPLPSEPLFVINKSMGLLKGEVSPYAPIPFICCIPLEKDSAPDDAIFCPSVEVFSSLYRGSYDGLREVYKRLAEEMREKHLRPTGYPRALGIVASYTGREIKAEDYVTRIAVPLGE